MTLQDAWEKRKELWIQGSKLIEEGNRLWKEISLLPGSVRVGVWYQLSETSKEAAEHVFHGYAIRTEADGLWHDAVVEAKGPKAKVVWIYDDQVKAYQCILEDGQEFK